MINSESAPVSIPGIGDATRSNIDPAYCASCLAIQYRMEEVAAEYPGASEVHARCKPMELVPHALATTTIVFPEGANETLPTVELTCVVAREAMMGTGH